MELGVSIAEGLVGWKTAVRAEQLGFTTAWFEDSQMVAADPVVLMTLAAANTSRIKLGSGVLIPSNRIAPQTANSFATLNALAPGRIILGVGTGFSGRRAMGHPPVRREELKTYMQTVKALLARDTVEWEFEGRRRKIRFVHPEKNFINTTDPIEIYIAAQGPKMIELTAELEANWMCLYTQKEAAVADINAMQRARKAAGVDGAALKSAIWLAGTPLADGERADSPKGIARGGPLTACFMHSAVESEFLSMGEKGLNPAGVDPSEDPALAGYRELYRSYEPSDARYLSMHRGHAVFVRDDERHLLTADLIGRMTMTASVGELRERFQELKRAGYDQFVFLVHPGEEGVLEEWVEVVEGI